jgi:hypothetical protein
LQDSFRHEQGKREVIVRCRFTFKMTLSCASWELFPERLTPAPEIEFQKELWPTNLRAWRGGEALHGDTKAIINLVQMLRRSPSEFVA